MAQMTPKKHSINEFNNNTGEEYGTQLSNPQDFTKVVESSVFSAEISHNLANNEIDNTEANKVGIASVEIVGTGTNKSFKFKNLKGATGNGITSVVKTNTDGLVDTYTITFNDDTTTTFTVTNGKKGDKGDTGEVSLEQMNSAIQNAIYDSWGGSY